MTDTDPNAPPERIWLDVDEPADNWTSDREDAEHDEVEYVRADAGSWYKESDIDALMAERDAASAEIARCHRRLEIDAHTDGNGVRVTIPMEDRASFPDGIECRDATIAGLDAMIDRLRAEVERLREALEAIVSFGTGWGPSSPATVMYDRARAALSDTTERLR